MSAYPYTDETLSHLVPEALGEYTVEVKAEGRISVMKVKAISGTHALARAFDAKGISGRILRSPVEHVEEES